jgi:two-component system sensor histidine kinase KdpD
MLSCDVEKVSQVLTILLSNAAKYSPAGSSVVVASQGKAEYVEVTVTDHGVGMPADFDDRLFVGYQQRAAKSGVVFKSGISSGLGLPIARQIIEMHGGRLWFERTAHSGSEFHFTIPVQVRPSRELKAVARAG